MGFQGLNNKVFNYYGCLKASGYRILSSKSSQIERRLGNEPKAYNPRRYLLLFSHNNLHKIEDYLKHADIKQHLVT